MFNLNRQTMGNLGLAIFLAFLVTLFSNIGSAAALELEKGTPEPGQKYNMLYFYSSDPAEFQSFAEKLIQKLTHYNKHGYVSGVTEVVYTTAYDDVYHQLGYLVYLIYDGCGKPGTLDTFNIGHYGNVYNDLSLTSQWDRTIWVKPKGHGGPNDPPGIETSTGTIYVDQKTGKATLVVDLCKVQGQLDNPALKALLLEVPSKLVKNLDNLEVELSVDVLKAHKKAGKDLIVKLDGVTLQVPRSVIAGITLNDGETLVIKSSKLKGNPHNPNGGELVSAVYDIGFVAKSEEQSRGITDLKGRIGVTLPVDPQKAKGKDPRKFSIFRLIPQGNGQYFFFPVGGKLNRDGTVTAYPNTLGQFAILYYSKTFTDITHHWGKEAIELMASRQFAKGMTSELFAPDQPITRAQFAAFLQRSLGLEEVNAQAVAFSDVQPGSWYYGAVQAAAKAGLVKGYGDGTFHPDGQITRQEMAVMIANALRSTGKAGSLSKGEINKELAKFQDRQEIADWAKESVAIAAKAGIIKGRGDGFAPQALATRAEGMMMVKNLLVFLGWL